MKIKTKFLKVGAICLAVLVAVAAIVAIVINNDFDRAVKQASKNLTEYTISAEFDEQSKTVSASQKVSYLNETDDVLNSVCFHLYPVAFKENSSVVPYTALTEARCFPNGKNYGDFKITSLNVNGEPAQVNLVGEDRDCLVAGLPNGLAKGKRAEIEMNFVITLANCTHRLGWFNNNVNLGNWFPIACQYLGSGEWDTTPYYATGDPFFSGVANFFVSFTAPQTYQIIASGEEVSANCSQNKLTKKFEGRAIRDFAVVLTSDSNVYSDSLTNTKVNYYSQEDPEVAKNHLKLALEALFNFNDWFGDYPYRTLNIVATPFMQGGMEYPGLVMASNLISEEEEYRKVIVHETAHQWWYGVVGNNEVVDAWFDEGLAEFSTFLFFDKNPKYGINLATQVEDAVAGYNLYLEVFNTINISVNRKMNLKVNEYQTEYEYTYMVYVKGAIMFNEVFETLGERAFLRGLSKLYKENKFKIVDKEIVCRAFGSNKNKVEEILTKYINGTSVYDV